MPEPTQPGTTIEAPALPSFLRRCNGRLELVLHCTQVQTFKVCPLKYWIRHGLNVERAVPKPSLNYGGAIHEALSFRYKRLDLPLSDVEQTQSKLLAKWFAAKPPPEGEWRDLTRAVQSIAAYNAAYPAHDWDVFAVEEEFEAEVGAIELPKPIEHGGLFGTQLTLTVVLKGRRDMVVGAHEGVWVLDWKTCSEWGDNPETNKELLAGKRSFQFRGYCWAEREAQRQRAINARREGPDSPRDLLPVKGVIGSYIVGRKPFSEAAAAVKRRAGAGKPRDEHHLEYFPFSDAKLDEWRDECLLTARRIVTAWQTNQWEQSFDRGCAYYGRCEFYEACEGETSLESSLYRLAESVETEIEEEL